MLPRSVPSLFGGFPESLREELQGFVSDPDWEEGRNRPALEYAKVAHSPLMSGSKKRTSDGRTRYALQPYHHASMKLLLPQSILTVPCCIHHPEG